MRIVRSSSPLLGRGRLLIGVALGALLAVTPVTAATGSPATNGAPAGISGAAAQAPTPVIVLLKDQHADTPARGPLAARRRTLVHADQAPLIAQARRDGATRLTSFSVINGFAATVDAAAASRLRQDPRVRALVPDRLVRGRAPAVRAASADASTRPAAGSHHVGPVARGCTSDPASPNLEPQALELTHTASQATGVPSAQDLADGAGVRVANIAEDVSLTNPDLIRADGSPVITGHADFTGEGFAASADGGEAWGDVSSIAAQGRSTYNLHDYYPAAPAGCTIRIRGVAPAASVVALKAFGKDGNAPSSRLVQAIDYAVNEANVDVINESFGDNPWPDLNTDPVALADEAAVNAGITVVVCSMDGGPNGTVATPASDPAVISVGASTQFRAYQQLGINDVSAGSGAVADDNVSAISSGGVTEQGRVPDLIAPGDLGWSLCDANAKLFTGCGGRPIQLFGGTSEAAPLTAGGAALVIQGYAATHHGARPTPALVKQILTSTATDVDAPAYEQGAGRLDTYAAVRAARSVRDGQGAPTPAGSALLVGPSQLTATAAPGERRDFELAVVNAGARAQRVSAAGRTLARRLRQERPSVTLDGKQPSGSVSFTVPPGADRIDLAYAYPVAAGNAQRVGVALIDPLGTYQAYSLPQGAGGYGRAEAADPAPGVWRAVVTARGPYHGQVRLSATSLAYQAFGSVSPATLTLAPGARGVFHVRAGMPSSPGDVSAAVRLTTATRQVASVPLTLRSLIVAKGGAGAFSGVLAGGNGRAFAPGQTSYYYLDVPTGAPDLGVGVRFAGDPHIALNLLLVSPDGQTLSRQSNVTSRQNGSLAYANTVQVFRDHPAAGRWLVLLEEDNPVSGAELEQPFTGLVRFGAVEVSATGLPRDARLAAGKPVTATVRVRNTGLATATLFADGRLVQTGPLPIRPDTPGSDRITLPFNANNYVEYTVPTQLRSLSMTAAASASATPISVDMLPILGQTLPNDPEVYVESAGRTATATVRADEVATGLWGLRADQVGPFPDGGAPSCAALLSAVGEGRLFDPALSASTGDRWLRTVRADAPYRPLVLAPGQSGVITVRIVPTGKPGAQVRGTLFVDDFNEYTHNGDELTGIPYSYTIAGPAPTAAGRTPGTTSKGVP
jgi:hypothetical protein